VWVPEAGDALELALRALGRRDFAARELDERLAARGVAEDEREQAIALLQRTGLLDDRRSAIARASALAQRGAGDALIRHDLASRGIAAEFVEDALAGLEPELDRARQIVARRGAGPRTARFLHGKGFPGDVVGAVAGGDEEEIG
jgi:regulatory protein